MGSRMRAGELLVLLNTFFMLVVMPVIAREKTQSNNEKKIFKNIHV